ncbi:MAG: hypothetical protein Q9M35_05565, partial [Rhodothermus sp.]|nr:hypothetical protein [Rhodothermus sp.]
LPALERALHAVMVAAVRQLGPVNVRPDDECVDSILDWFRGVLDERVKRAGAVWSKYSNKVFERRKEEWNTKKRSSWNEFIVSPEMANKEYESRWVVPTSMRHVDREVNIKIEE